MNIADAAKAAGLPAKTIRYYEEIDLVTPGRDANGYRRFLDADIHKLTFLSRARALGFTIADCRVLLSLWEDKSCASAEVRSVAKAHLDQISRKISDLQQMEATLRDLVKSCAGDNRPECPILENLGRSEN